jgi:hypothetical protein
MCFVMLAAMLLLANVHDLASLFRFFLLRPCAIDQWLEYHSWYVYHSLKNHDICVFILPYQEQLIYPLEPSVLFSEYTGSLPGG